MAETTRRSSKKAGGVIDVPPKTCQYEPCGGLYYPASHHTEKRWEKTKYCSQEHLFADRRKVAPETKTCEGCGVTYPRPSNLDHERWLTRRFHNAECRRKSLTPAGRKPRVRARKSKPKPEVTVAPTVVQPQGEVWRPANLGRDVRPKVKESAA